MILVPEKILEDALFNYLKENKGKAYTVSALEEILKKFLPKINKKERINLFLKILNILKNNEKIDSIEHNGEPHYFYLQIFDYDQYKLHKTHYSEPDTFISSGRRRNKIKIRYCKRCKKEVMLQFRERRFTYFEDSLDPRKAAFWFDSALIWNEKYQDQLKNIGWFCPSCGERFTPKFFTTAKLILYLIGVILLVFLLLAGTFLSVDLQVKFNFYIGALALSLFLIIVVIIDLILWILKKSGRKAFDKLKDLSKETLENYMKKNK